MRYIKNSIPEEHDLTVEDVHNVNIEIPNKGEVPFKILDTAGEEDYRTMMDKWITESDGYLLVFAINDQESFDDVKTIYDRLKKNGREKYPIILVGNKCDLMVERQVDEEIARNYAKEINVEYYEASAKTDNNGNCKVIFQKCAQLIDSKSPSPTGPGPTPDHGSCPCVIY